MSDQGDALAEVIQRSYFTVTNGHLWTMDDHQALVIALRSIVSPQTIVELLGASVYFVLCKDDCPAGAQVLGVYFSEDEAYAAHLALWVSGETCPSPFKATGAGKLNGQDVLFCLLEVKIGGGRADVEPYIYG